MVLASCGGNARELSPSGNLDPEVAAVTEGAWYRPGIAATWQWQLQGAINTGYDVDAYDIDLFDTPASLIADLQSAGRRVICYFSAGSYEDFRDDSAQFLETDLGKTLDGFAEEKWLDIRSANVQSVMLSRLELAVAKGCDAVEPDNVDGVSNPTGFELTATDQIAYNRFLANQAHMRGLGVGLKNDLEQIPALVEYFDFSLNEQCNEYEECDLLTPFIDADKAVFVAEYLSRYVNDQAERDSMCAAARTADRRTLILALDLDDSLRISCDE